MLETLKTNGSLVTIVNTDDNTTFVLNLDDVTDQRLVNLALVILDLAILLYILLVISCNTYVKRGHHGNHYTRTGKLSSLVFNACKVIAIFFLMGYIAIQVPVIFGCFLNYCDAYNKMEYTMGFFVITLTYFVIWLRTYTLFYGNQLARNIVKTPLKGFSIAAIVYFIIIAVVNLFYFLFSPTYAPTEFGCAKMMNKRTSLLPWLVFGITNGIYQIWLFFLLIYPMYVHSRRMHKHGIRCEIHLRLIRRATASTSICLALNMAAVLVGIFEHNRLTYLRNALISTILVAILLTLICTFDDWRIWFVPRLTLTRSGDSESSPFRLNRIYPTRGQSKNSNQRSVLAK